MLTNTNIYIYIYIFNSVEKERLSFSSVHCAVAIKSKAEYVASHRIRRDRYIYTCGDKRLKKRNRKNFQNSRKLCGSGTIS